MPQNQRERVLFAFITVVFTVHAYVFYSLYVVNGGLLMELTGAPSVTWKTMSTVDGSTSDAAIRAQGGVYMLGGMRPIWAVVLVEFLLAFTLENVLGSPCSFRLACKVFDPRTQYPMLVETAVICATVGLMCPAMIGAAQ